MKSQRGGTVKVYQLSWLFQIIVKVCNGVEFDSECCSKYEKCCINQGDCDSDNECSGALVCGKDNCPSPFPSDADCCENPGPGNFSLMVLNSVLMKL